MGDEPFCVFSLQEKMLSSLSLSQMMSWWPRLSRC